MLEIFQEFFLSVKGYWALSSETQKPAEQNEEMEQIST